MTTPRIYPPPGHLLRQLGITLDRREVDRLTSTMPVPAEICDASGEARLAVIGVMVDMAAGTLTVRQVEPDWTATFDLAIHRIADAPAGSTLHAVSQGVRAGRNSVVSETTVDADGEPVAYAEVTFSRLPRRGDTPVTVVADVVDYGKGEAAIAEPVADVVGFERRSPGVVEFGLRETIRNSFGSVQGGVVAVSLEDAAIYLAASTPDPATGVPMVGPRLGFLHVYYLGAAKGGPFRSTATVLRHQPSSSTARVELLDVGGDRLMAQGTAIAEPAD